MQAAEKRKSSTVIGAMAAVTIVCHLVCINAYGIFRDELYYLACGEHLDWGYVDQPPMIALIAGIARHLGHSLFAVRIFAVLGGAALVAITGLLARRLGGGIFAQFLASLAALIAPLWLSLGHFLSMNIFETLLWMAMAYVLTVILDGGDERLWLLFGLLAGLGLETKHTTLFFGSAIVIGLLLTKHRRHFARPWIWLGGVLALIVFAPNLIWEWRHHFATVELLQNIARSNKNAPITLWSFLIGQLLLIHPINAVVWISGLVWLFRSDRYRPFAIAFIALFAEFVILKGKIYYLGPIYPLLLAAGAIVIGRWPRAARIAFASALVVTGALVAPMSLPILPVKTFIAYSRAIHLQPPATENHRMGPLPQHYADMFGWPELAASVANVWSRQPDKQRCAIFGQNYGEAGAIDWYGGQYGLPHAISAHQNYYYWGHREFSGDCVVVLGDDREKLQMIFEHVELGGTFHHPYVMPYENDLPIWVCRGMMGPFDELWPQIKNWR
jgi:hypothetical protein